MSDVTKKSFFLCNKPIQLLLMMMMLWKQMASKSKNTPRPICHITFSSNGKNLKYETRAKKLWTLGGMSSPFSCLALDIVTPVSQCLKIIEKVAFTIASEAIYVYILSREKFVINSTYGQFWWVLKTWSFRSNSVTGQF